MIEYIALGGTFLIDYKRKNLIATHLVGDCAYNAAVDIRMLQQDSLNLDRSDVFTASANDILAPVHEIQRPVIAFTNDIACMPPATFPAFFSCSRVLVVAAEEI